MKKSTIKNLEKTKKLIILLFSFSLLTLLYAQEDKLEFLIKGNEYTLSLLKSGTVECECNTEFSQEFLEERGDPAEKYEITAKFKGEKYYQDLITTHAKSKKRLRNITAYNEKYTTAINMEIGRNGEEINKTGAIYPEKMRFLPHVYSMQNMLSDLLKKSSRKRLIGERIINKERSYEIEIEVPNSIWKIFIVPEHGYLIKKAISVSKDKGEIKSIYEVKKFQNFSREIWYPVEVIRTFYKGGEFIQKDHIVFTKFIPNQEIPDSVFTLKFPKGLLVWDGITKTSFFVP